MGPGGPLTRLQDRYSRDLMNLLLARHSRFEYYFNAAIFLVLECLIHFWRILQRDFMCNDERGIDLTLFNTFKADRHIFLHVGLTRLKS